MLVSAVFEAFVTIFQRKMQRHIRLARNGSGVLPAGEFCYDLRRQARALGRYLGNPAHLGEFGLAVTASTCPASNRYARRGGLA